MLIKKITAASLILLLSFSGQAMHHATKNGEAACKTFFPTQAYCYPIHGSDNLKSNQALIIKFSDTQTPFFVLSGQTGYTTADNPAPTKTLITVQSALIKNHVVIAKDTLYKGHLGLNKVGLTCDFTHCGNWNFIK